MINPMKYKYLVAIMTADKKAYDITQFVEDVSWEEGEDQLAARISFSAKNDKTSKGRISSLAKPGCYAALLYSYNGGKNAEATRGKIVESNPSARTSGEKFKVKAYDVLYDLQESQDHVYFSAGVKTKSAIVQVLKRWGIKVTSYSGPNVKHGKLAYKAKLNICFDFSCMKRAIEKSKFNSTFLEEAMEIQRMISCGVIMLMIDTTTISVVCWAIPDLFDRIGCDVLIFFHGIEQVFTNWQTPTIFSTSDCKGIINNFLPTIHEVYQSAQRGCCMVRSIDMDMDTT